MKQLAVILCATMALGSCSNNDDISNSIVIATAVEITVQDMNGGDLLNPNNDNAYQAQEIKLFYKIDGELVEIYDSMMDHPKNFYIYQYESEFRIVVFLNYNRGSQQPITYIQWNETDTDTLKAEFRYPNNSSVILEKVWFNGEVKDRHFEIVK